ncbi:UpxY family transcription antiterminator [Gaetbulibacter aquiaggeris]|uniref:UpxY family transcription antiterminator n=1 Tax=Gaetbulibacter aquiaggeris TaxID=1735373 RepID=A0ABW7MRS7_9FLAO
MSETENWYVLYTKPNREKKVLSQLLNLDMTVYCPMVTTMRQWSDRKKKIEAPLIPRVIFIKCSEQDRNKVFEVSGPQHYLFWLGKPAIVQNAEIETMQAWLQQDISEANVIDLKTGDTYVIQNNVFKGQEGVIYEVSKNRVQIVLKELGMKVTITKENRS